MNPLSCKFGDCLHGAAWEVPYEVPTNEPSRTRRLRIYALDPSLPRSEGAIAIIEIPYEVSGPGPSSALFQVELDDPESTMSYTQLDLDSTTSNGINPEGLEPDPGNPRFHAQMVYAVSVMTYESFRKALGRHVYWAFQGDSPQERVPLRLRPFAHRKLNAWYDRKEKSISFGYAMPKFDATSPIERQSIFTSLSSDVIAHEVSHALIDGLKPYYIEQTNPDVQALHESISDLVAIFQRFTYTELVTAQLRKLRGRLDGRSLLRVIAPQVGDAKQGEYGLRTLESLLGTKKNPNAETLYDRDTEDISSPHLRGKILSEAIFDAFQTIVARKTEPIFGIASNGTGKLPKGRIPEGLLEFIVHATTRTAHQFLTICVRAIDYCPPVHVDFGDYLRALITADFELVKHDRLGYREAIVASFLARGIIPAYVQTPSEATLIWSRPNPSLPAIQELALNNLNFRGDPTVPYDSHEPFRLGELFVQALAKSSSLRQQCGLKLSDSLYSIPEIVSVRASRRVGPNDQVAFDLIIDIVQHRWIDTALGKVQFRGGATVVIDAHGQIRFIVRKRIDQPERRENFEQFIEKHKASLSRRTLAGSPIRVC